MSNCTTNKAATELILPALRTPSQIQNKPKPRNIKHVRNGGGAPQPSKILSATRSLGIDANKSFPDFDCIKQVKACFLIEPGTNDESSCAKCPTPPPEPECGFPLPSPSPCCQPKPACDCPPAPVPPPKHCVPICGRVNKIEFNDPCASCEACKWSIIVDACGRNALVFQCCDCDKALLDCDGNFNLVGNVEAKQFCLAPTVATPQQQWCVHTNTATGMLQFDNIDREHPLLSNQSNAQSISFTKSGTISESVVDVSFTPSENIFVFTKNELPATIIAHNLGLLANKQIDIDEGLYNGQKVTVVNVHAANLAVNLHGNVKLLGGESLLVAVWCSAAATWISK